MATRDPEAKRRQLLDAARVEFSEHGIAGARIDRIAARAKCSAGLVYTYFGSKDDLYDAVFDGIVARTVSEVPIDAGDLPAYAGRLFDSSRAHPEVARIATWYRLERAGTGKVIPAIMASNKAKADAVREAQRAGLVSDRFDAEQLLMLVLTIAMMWSSMAVETAEIQVDPAYQRATIIDAVRRLVEP